MNKLILFGGSFDPIHKAHVYIAKKAMKFLSANKLSFVLCYKSPNKNRKLTYWKNRLEMMKLAISNNKKFSIIDYEIKSKKISYTIDLINWFIESNNQKENDIYFLIGEDQYQNFHLWKNFEEILLKVKVIVYPRFNDKIIENNNLTNYKDRFIFLNNIKRINISSSILRLKPQKKYLNEKVLNYINANGLYAIERLKNNVSNYRYCHSIRVKNIGMKIAKSLNLSKFEKKQIYIACIYHDFCKEMKKQQMLKLAKKLNITNYPSWKVLHGYIASYYIKKHFFIEDKVILKAIEDHTIINIDNNSLISKIVYVSDKMDVRKDWKIHNYDYLIQLILQNFNKAFKIIVKIIEKEYVKK